MAWTGQPPQVLVEKIKNKIDKHYTTLRRPSTRFGCLFGPYDPTLFSSTTKAGDFMSRHQ